MIRIRGIGTSSTIVRASREVGVFGIGGGELALIIIVLLIFVGPDKLPQVAKTVGTGLRDLRRAANLAQSELRQGMEELTREVQDVTRDVQAVVDSASRDLDPSKPAASKQPTAQAEAAKAPAITPGNADTEPTAVGDGPEVLAHVRRRVAESRTPDESPAPWSLHTQPAALDEDLGPPSETNRSRSKTSFRMPTAEPLPGTMARGAATVAEAPLAASAAAEPQATSATVAEAAAPAAPDEPAASDPPT